MGTDLYVVAWRNLWRNRRRTMITLFSFAFGALMAITFTGLADSSYGKMINLAARTGAGHLAIQHHEYLDSPTLKKTVRDSDRLSQLALQQPHVVRAVPRVVGSVMLATAKSNYGAYMIAFDPTLETPQTLALLDSVVEGEMFQEADDDRGIVLGAVLADNLDVALGKKVVYTMTDKHGEIVSGLARVTGIVRTGSPTVDSTMCLLPIGMVRRSLGLEDDESTQVAVFVDDEVRADEVAAELAMALGDEVAVPTWRQTQPELAAFIQIDASGAVVFEFIILILVAAGIFNSMFVSVMERQRELGIMMALGFTPGQVARLVLWEALWLGLVGLVVSAVLTVFPYWYLYSVGIDYSAMIGEGTEVSGVVLDPVLRVDIRPYKVVVIGIIMMVTTFLAAVYPAWRASRVVPVEAIKRL